ncbi:hypothetical protein [Actinoplanes sp. NBRC 103695]|uniref:hypothetical protein n=1 Tax=Actinoplanes sp. NBRC 103695 TaxID=3032202 RepID=UPI0024A41E79|nr:hypothetical protein [Actinoplanes sp. NBRC 103695]GLZ02505.1 hypothetical protein Acsp02_97560 [Actinoplanes sp. NBRC 103695]
MLHVAAAAAEHAQRGANPMVLDGPAAETIERATESDYPHVYAVRDHLLAGTAEQRLRWAIDILVMGVTQQPSK